MNPSEQEIESVLRHAPQPKAPEGLRKGLMAQVKLSVAQSESQPRVIMHAPGGWLRRWWPALAPATASLACAVVLMVQQMEINGLKETLRVSPQGTITTETAPPPATSPANEDTSAIESQAKEQQEIARLKQLADQLTAEVVQLEQMRKENERLRAQIASPPGLTAGELDALAKAKERAQAIQCVNNMKQLGLAARMWAIEHNDLYAPDIISMTNEINTPKILACPADTNRPVTLDWRSYTPANCSYDYLAPGGTSREAMRVLFRCSIHGSIGLCDGSVQMEVAKKHPESLIEREGKLYYEPKARP